MINYFNRGSLALNRAAQEEKQYHDVFKRHLNLVDGKVRVIQVSTLQELESFVKLSHEIYKDTYAWPGQDDEVVMGYFDYDQSPYLGYSDMQPFLAYRDGEIVGRICATINDHFNEHWETNVGFFGFFECINDQDVANELLGTAEKWVLDRGLSGIYGPMSPTYLEEVGILLNDFDKVPAMGMSYNHPYYSELIENYGFEKVKDVLHPNVKMDTLCEKMEKKMPKIDSLINDVDLTIRYFDRENFDRDAEIVRDLFYQTFYNHWGYYPAEPEEWKSILREYMEDIHEDMFLIIQDRDEPIAFTLAFKDTNQELHAKRHGYDVKEITRQKWDIVGIKKDYHRNGMGTYMVYNLLQGLKNHGTKELCGSWVLEDNYSSLGLCRSLGLEFNTTYRVYQKQF